MGQKSDLESIPATTYVQWRESIKARGLKPSLRKSWWRQLDLSGWRAGAALSCTVAFVVLLINTILLTWAIYSHGLDGGTGTLFTGSCAKAKSINTWLGLGINALCTILLGASNYCMQCLTSPTRDEVDKAHAKQQLLRIGVPSFRNLKAMEPYRTALWLGLGLSAVPLHFVYNSAVYMTTQANAYRVLAAPSEFSSPTFNQTAFYADLSNYTLANILDLYNESVGSDEAGFSLPYKTKDYFSDYRYNGVHFDAPAPSQPLFDLAQTLESQVRGSNLVPLSASECMDAYSSQYISKWGDLLIVEKSDSLYFTRVYNGDRCDATAEFSLIWNSSSSNWKPTFEIKDLAILSGCYPSIAQQGYSSIIGTTGDSQVEPAPSLQVAGLPSLYPSNAWRCPGGNTNCSRPPNDWAPLGGSVSQCWAEKVPEFCTLNFSLSLSLVVIACNATKFFCMLLTIRLHWKPALITIGDAIHSFLEKPDETTRGKCLYSDTLMYFLWEWAGSGSRSSLQQKLLLESRLERLRRPAYRPEAHHWAKSASLGRWLSCFCMFGLAYFLGITLLIVSMNGTQNENLQVEAPVGKNIMPFRFSLFATALIANLPQVLLSYIYVAFNSLFTCMLAGQEYMQYFSKQRPLRVTSPVGRQRSTYYLQLPYCYSLPLLVLSSLLSWSAAQSLFVVRVVIRDPHNLLPPGYIISTCGYSSGAIMLTIVVGTLIVMATGATGLRNHPLGMPIAATCSGAISAACHPPDGDTGAALLPVQWGVVSIKDGLGHCSFSSKLVAPPIPGQKYE